ncbi:hypothetical protein K432DRAFT_296275 [Lepidopterella palustris CBS 459.81]|uniref:Uncharacterized protein n=1 Tax=Lepidopterella palustris CBS 459.81 TaxID=1314670 RepID=A0A8E2EC89_9PEZI|nr:hypothetical protein K432DRAFT_296275 [Lepidopterella palustris CBS 459.81]
MCTGAFGDYSPRQSKSSCKPPSFNTQHSFGSNNEFPSPTFQRARRPALVPQNSSLSLAEAEELVRNRISQPLFPPPNSDLINQINFKSSSSSPDSTPSPSSTPEMNFHPERPFTHDERLLATARSLYPTSSATDTRRRALWLKARAHYARDRKMRLQAQQSQGQASPKRKHSAFLLDEEMKYYMEDFVGTPHLSEMVPGDVDNADLGAEDFGMDDTGMLESSGDHDTQSSPRRVQINKWFESAGRC